MQGVRLSRTGCNAEGGGAPSATPSKLDVLVVPALLPVALRLGKLKGADLPPSSFSWHLPHQKAGF